MSTVDERGNPPLTYPGREGDRRDDEGVVAVLPILVGKQQCTAIRPRRGTT
jgi:hypothetical protein